MINLFTYQFTKFIGSSCTIYDLPLDNNVEVAFIGYSNSGKSSTINLLTNKKKLAKFSKKPGCTNLINIYEIKKNINLLDFPGYGYSINFKKNQHYYTLKEYIINRISLKGLVIFMDIRYPMKKFDIKIIKLSILLKLSILILLSKIDKISFNVCNKQLNNLIKNNLFIKKNQIQIEFFSTFKKIGLNKLKNKLNNWFLFNKKNNI